ncbi:MAG TPA: RsmE family RNA methyltransferase [Alkalispirochaeta sp.]|nr:RsmE family RNA methyltransferase [Alkalispirochaeta sp.]
MKQLVVSAVPAPGEVIELTEEQYHYLVRVRRVAEGMEIPCIDGGGPRATTAVIGLPQGPRSIALRVVDRSAPDDGGPSTGAAIPVTLYMALLKGKKLDTVVRQVTELGVDRIVPVITQHCVSRPDAGDLQRKGRRWEGIVREATQQSGRVSIPTVEPPAVLQDVGSAPSDEHVPPSMSLVFHEAAHTVLSIAETVDSTAPPGEIRVLVGPEGGLAPGEVEYLSHHGWQVRRMPVPVLRAETAAVAAAALVQSLRSEYTASAS